VAKSAALYHSLHADSWKLAQSGGIEIGLSCPAMPRYRKDPDCRQLCAGKPALGIAGSITPHQITGNLTVRTRAGKFGYNRILLRGLRTSWQARAANSARRVSIAAERSRSSLPASGNWCTSPLFISVRRSSTNDISRALVDSCRIRCRHPLEALAGRKPSRHSVFMNGMSLPSKPNPHGGPGVFDAATT